MQLFHNPHCSKSRATLALLQEHGFEPQIVDYVGHPPTADEIRALLVKLGIGARELLRPGEAAYAELGLADETLGDDALIDAMATHPHLIERPILVHNGRAVIGRPPERVLELLD